MRTELVGIALMMTLVSAYSTQAAESPDLVCSDEGCVSLEAMEASIRRQVDGQTVGYAFAIGVDEIRSGGGGLARTRADGAELAFAGDTPLIIASVSKWLTAIATMRLLDERGVSLDDPIGPYLPSDWGVDPFIRNISFAQLLSQTSGIKDLGNGPPSYERTRRFVSTPVVQGSTTPCGGPGVVNPPNPVTPNNLEFCYSNYNFALLGLLLPKLAGLPEDDNLDTRPQTLAVQYEAIVQEKVFAPVGVDAAACAPIGEDYALSYIYPGDQPGQEWGAQYARCAQGGWYVSPEGVARVLASLSARDGRILRETDSYSSLAVMRERRLGLDRSWPQLIEKDGLLGGDAGVLAASAVIFQPDGSAPLPAVLVLNSNHADGSLLRPRPILEQAYEDALVEN